MTLKPKCSVLFRLLSCTVDHWSYLRHQMVFHIGPLKFPILMPPETTGMGQGGTTGALGQNQEHIPL